MPLTGRLADLLARWRFFWLNFRTQIADERNVEIELRHARTLRQAGAMRLLEPKISAFGEGLGCKPAVWS